MQWITIEIQSFSKGDVILKKLVIADIVLLFLSKLSKVPAALFALLGKMPFFGLIFRFISKIFLLFGKLLTIPFYILTAILIIMLLLKLFKSFKKEDKIDNQPYQTSTEYAQENNRKAVTQGDPNRMNIFKEWCEICLQKMILNAIEDYQSGKIK